MLANGVPHGQDGRQGNVTIGMGMELALVKRLCRLWVPLLLVWVLGQPVCAWPGEGGVRDFRIPAQGLASALRQLAEQQRLQIVFSAREVERLSAPALQGKFTLEEAMNRLLAGTSLGHGFNGLDTVVVRERTTTRHDGERPSGGVAPPVLDEIIVTAERRRESLQKVPIALTAFKSRALEYFQVSNVMHLAGIVPSVSVVPFAGSKAAPNLFIRGMGGTDTQTTKDNATGIYLDGVPVGRGTGLAADIADLERVEVLRGPQGTLYGRNTTAGAINFINHQPGPDFSFEQRLSAGNLGFLGAQARWNLPLAENLFARVAYVRSVREGWVRNTNATLPDQVDFNREDKEAARLAIRLLAGDGLTVDYSLDGSTLLYGNTFYQVIQGDHAHAGRQERTPAVKGLQPSDARIAGDNLTLTLNLAGGTVLKSITARRSLDSTVNQNYIDSFVQWATPSQRQISQEFQLIGDALDRRIDYVAGLFYFRERSNEWVDSRYSDSLAETWRVKSSSESRAVFGQITWQPSVLDNRLRLTVGGRQTVDDRGALKHFIRNDFEPGIAGVVVTARKRFRRFNPALTVDYAFSDESSAYLRLATGYRAGGFNTRSTRSGFVQGFGPESVRAHELGFKSELLDHRLRLNLAAFSNRYNNLQVDQVRVPAFFTDTLNAARARVDGIETELVVRWSDALSAELFYSRLRGRYLSYLDGSVDLADVKKMSNMPTHQGRIGLQYELGRHALGRTILGLDYRWQGSFYSGPNEYTYARGYGIWNGRLQLIDHPLSRGRVRLAAWGRNLTDRAYILAANNLGSISAQFGEPRTLGLDVSYEF